MEGIDFDASLQADTRPVSSEYDHFRNHLIYAPSTADWVVLRTSAFEVTWFPPMRMRQSEQSWRPLLMEGVQNLSGSEDVDYKAIRNLLL